VLVDGRMAPDQAGEPVYSPRPAEELAQIESLVRSAIGFDAARGDVVEVKSMPFSAPPPLEEEAASWLQLTKYDLMRLAELAALALVALMLILLVVRPLLRRLLPLPAAGAAAGLPGAHGALLPGALPTPALAAPPGDEDGVQLDPDARQRAELVKRARGVIEEAPDEAVAIIRSWLHET